LRYPLSTSGGSPDQPPALPMRASGTTMRPAPWRASGTRRSLCASGAMAREGGRRMSAAGAASWPGALQWT